MRERLDDAANRIETFVTTRFPWLWRNVERLKQLRVEHRDLDQVIARLVTDPNVDQLMLKRLKKRKLMLKDMITQLESARIPDLNA